eukprot:TRINITY_DN206_c0_g1_i1.p1 TRINITY_DN206_c0_g1~~TRINITY_DN206_c0_g1_i1.p1  ORF type:complete len:545 (-),score=129.87 TRINITY_DN206_c0_g1_i1:23-1432(-)
MDTYIYTPATNYEIVPRVDTRVCLQSNGSTDDLINVLPDLTNWSYLGQTTLGSIVVDHWQQVVKNFNKTNTYDFYVDGTNSIPIKLVLTGYDFVFGSHPDIYIMDYDVWMPEYANDKEFVAPHLCDSGLKGNGVSAVRNAHYLRILQPLGGVSPAVSDMFAEHVAKQSKQYDSAKEYNYRMSVFAKNLAFIESYNRQRSEHTGVKLAMNHFGDLEHEEYRAMILPRKGVSGVHHAHHVHEKSADVPDAIDWRQLGAVNMVKDQGVCGSCWSFGATGSLEGINFVTNRVLVSLSEQQVIGCAWGDQYAGSAACDGGESWGAYQWVQDNGGIATEQSYPYLMQDSYCEQDRMDSGIKVTGFVNVSSGDESALQSAVATAGPVAVAIDAAHPEFEFYSSGVYYNPACKNTMDGLDHAVLAVGYGTEDGQDYWIVKNSWSTHWGDNGYVKMARNHGNNCGIATDATYPIVAQQ